MTSEDVELTTLDSGRERQHEHGHGHEHGHELFPTISNYQTTDSNQPDSVHESFHQEASGTVENASVVLIGDDGASSICIDDFDADYQNAMSVLRTEEGQRTTNEPTDFDAYNKRVARDIVIREKIQQRQQRRRAKYFQSSRTYGNYFSQNPANDTFTPSHTFDNFNGRRQNPNYNHQLNKLNTPFTYEGRHHNEEYPVENAVQPDDASFITLDVDALESDDGEDDEDEDDDDDEEASLLENHTPYEPKLKRKLYSRHLQMMALGSSLGIGVLVNTGEVFFYAGPVGTILGYVMTGLVALCTMSAFGEIVALVPSESGFSGIASRFVDKSLGFALGLCYWWCCAMALPSEVVAAAITLTYYPELAFPRESVAVWITFFLLIVLIINLFDAGIFGEVQFVTSFISMMIMTFLMIFMFAMNNGNFTNGERIGFRYWDSSKSQVDKNLLYGAFRPVFPLQLHKLKKNGTIDVQGVGGQLGQFLQTWYAITRSAFSYVGTEMVFMTAGEVRNPRKSVPAATRKIFFRVLLFYVLAVFAVSLNIFAGDPRLINLSRKVSQDGVYGTVVENGLGDCVTGHVSWGANMSGSNSSPWIISIQAVGQCSVAAGMNATIVFFALASGVIQLYASSRTLYGLSVQGLLWKGFGKCTHAGVPYFSVAASFAFALFAYLTTSHITAVVFHWLVSLTTSAGLLVWAGICFAFIRFNKGLQLRPDIVSRDDLSYPFRSPGQPYLTYFALFANCLIALTLGFPLFLRGQWDTSEFFTTYGTLIVFVLLYTGHKFWTKCKLVPLTQVDLDTGRKEMDRAGWQEDRVYKRGVGAHLKEYYLGLGSMLTLATRKLVQLVKPSARGDR